MTWAVTIIEVYLVALLLVVHLSLLFCKPDHCAFDGSPALKMLPISAVNLITKMLATIPVQLSSLQILAHFLLIGDAIYVIVIILKIVGAIIRRIIGVILMALVISFIVFILTQT